MKPYESYMIISDLDGTIIPHGGVVSEANKRAIESFRAGGGHFGIATGRTPEAAAGYLGGVAITAPSVFFNGSMLYDWQHERVLVTKPLTAQGAPDLWPRFAALCLERFPKACIEVYTQEDCHIISNPRYDDPRLPHEHYRYCHSDLADLADVRKTPWLKFFVCADPADLRELEREAEVRGQLPRVRCQGRLEGLDARGNPQDACILADEDHRARRLPQRQGTIGGRRHRHRLGQRAR